MSQIGSVAAVVAQVGQGVVGGYSPSPALAFFASLAVVLVVGWALLSFAPRLTDTAVGYAQRRPLTSGLVGVAAMAGAGGVLYLPVLSLGTPAELPWQLAVGSMAFLGVTCVALAIGSVATGSPGSRDGAVELVLGALVASATGVVPLYGDVFLLVLGAFGCGALLLGTFRVPAWRTEPDAKRGDGSRESRPSNDRRDGSGG